MLRFDVHAKLTPNGVALYEDLPCIRGTKKIIKQHLDNGSGEFAISRHSDAATAAIIARGNWVKAYQTELSTTEPIFTFQLETGDFDVISGDEQGGEHLSFGGPGNRSYLKNAIVWLVNFIGSNPINSERPGSWRWVNDQYGDIWERLLDEDAARPTPTMPALTRDWTGSLDSAGQPWPSFTGKFFLDIGLNYEEAANLMQDYDDLYIRMLPDFLMQAYKDDYGVDRSNSSFAAGKVRFVKGVNVKGDLQKNVYGPKKFTHVVVQGSGDTFVDVVAPSYDEGEERREGFLQHGETDSVPQLERAGLKLIRTGERNEDAIAWTGTVDGNTPLSGHYIPGPASAGGHFDEGDWVTIHTGGSGLDYNNRKIQVMSITYVELDNGEVDYIIEGDGSITAGDSASGDFDEDPCCGKPGSGIKDGAEASDPDQNAEIELCDTPPLEEEWEVSEDDGVVMAWDDNASNWHTGVGPSQHLSDGCQGAGDPGGSKDYFAGQRLVYGCAVFDIPECENIVGGTLSMEWVDVEFGAGSQTFGPLSIRGGFEGLTPDPNDIYTGMMLATDIMAEAGPRTVGVPANALHAGSFSRFVAGPEWRLGWDMMCCEGTVARSCINYGNLGYDISTGDLQIYHLTAATFGWIATSPVGTQDGSNTDFTLVGGYNMISHVTRNGIAVPSHMWSAPDSVNFHTVGWAPLASDNVEVRYRIPAP